MNAKTFMSSQKQDTPLKFATWFIGRLFVFLKRETMQLLMRETN